MRTNRLVCMGLATIAGMALCTWAAASPVIVHVGGQTDSGGYYGGTTPVLAFSPSSITIHAGESVTFINNGGAHNVHADDNSFRCANGCDGDGHSGNGNISGAQWSSTVTFASAGTVKYHCDMHVNNGMVGSITVLPAIQTSGFTIKPGLSGNWDDPTPGQDGHGFQFETLSGSPPGMLALWFVYKPDGSGQTWLFLQGAYDSTSDTVTLPAYISSGAKFPPNYAVHDLSTVQWGSIKFTFTDCDHGTAAWTTTAAGYPPSGSFPIGRVTTLAGDSCK